MAVCSYLYVCLIFLNACGCFSEAKVAEITRKAIQLKSAPVLQANEFTTFRDNMATLLGDTLVNSKEVQEWYNTEIVAAGKTINYNNNAEKNSIRLLLFSMMCAKCNGDCPCLRLYECNKQC